MSTVNLSAAQPTSYKRMVALSQTVEQAAAEAGLDPLLVELVKIRVSQLNGCAYCLRMHSRDAVRLGESADRLAVLPAWWESQYFDGRERAALALAEQVTDPSAAVRPEADAAELDEAQAAAVAWLAVVMNGWNRIAVTSHTPVGPAD